MDEHAAERTTSATVYLIVWMVLVGLTWLTYWVAHLDLGSFNLVASLAIAGVKSSLVVLFFMHLLGDKSANRYVLIVSIFWLALLVTLTVVDVATRFPLADPPGSVRYQVPISGQLE